MTAGVRSLGAALVIASVLAACGGSSHQRSLGTKRSPLSIPAPVQRDDWKPPSTGGGPSTGTFCRLLVADFTHVQTNAIATSAQVRKQIVGDFVTFTPAVIAAAPASIAAPASTYLAGIAKVLHILADADFNSANAPKGAIGNIIFDPAIVTAGHQLAAWSETNCHFDITSDGV